jgi:hypothetical protein
MRYNFCEMLATMAFTASASVVRHREWAADKRHSYSARLLFDKWAAQDEARMIELANRIIEWSSRNV